MEACGLSIGCFKSTRIADLITAYILESTKERSRKTICQGVYRGNDLAISEANCEKKFHTTCLKKLKTRSTISWN